MCSSDLKHVPKQDLYEKAKGEEWPFKASVIKSIVKYAKTLWEDRTDRSSPVLATHDTYLKLFQLSKPVFKDVGVLYVDEFQDTTPCVLDIVLNQLGHMQVVVVGDARQAIYGWRGAVNAMSSVSGSAYYLTKSFRYGPAIAHVATTVLEGSMEIKGHEPIQSVAGGFNVVDRTQPYTRIFRTNAGLLGAAVEEIVRGKRVNIEVDVKDFVRLLQSAQALYVGKMADVKHEDLLAFKDWGELETEAADNPDLGRVVRVIKSGDAPYWIKTLTSYVKPKVYDVTFTTAHKSKGREWDQVVLEPDFKPPQAGVDAAVEEQNLLYVACTRAIHQIGRAHV